MKICPNIKADLSAYIDGELPPARQNVVRSHLEVCPDCRRELLELQQLSAGLSALPRLEPAPQFLAAIRRKIRQPEQPSSTWVEKLFHPAWPKIPLEALAVVALVAGVFFIVRTDSRQEEPVLAKSTMPAGTAPSLQARILDDPKASHAEADSAALPMAPVAKAKEADLSYAPSQPEQPKMAASVATEPPAAPEIVIVKGETLVAVQLRAEKLAQALQGRFDSVTRSNTLLVHVPRSKVKSFRNQISKTPETFTTAPYSPQPALAKSESVTDSVVEVEIVVEAAAKPAQK